MFGFLKRQKLDLAKYDRDLVEAIDDAKYDYEKAKLSEEAMFESEVDPRLIQAETAKAKQKYFFLLRAARERKMKGHWQTAFVRPEV